MLNILILCTGNSCRSQMGEALLVKLISELDLKGISVYSAGIEKHGLNPRAMKVLKEINIDVSKLSSKLLTEFDSTLLFDLVLTVCSNASESCPVFSGEAKIIHHGFEDPPFLTKEMEDEKKVLEIFLRGF